MILIPVKNLGRAKQRLAAVLDQVDRTELAQAMLEDILGVLANWPQHPDVSLVASDPFACELAKEFRFAVIADEGCNSETEAIAWATRECEGHGVESTLVIPGDIPLIQESELEAIYAAAPDVGSVLVPAGDGRGTNAALRRPAGLFPLRFGNDSFLPHAAAARATGHACEVLQLSGIALDVDNPEDLRQLADAPGKRRAQILARQWGFSALPIAANE
jgi:2-phospho-L-lactate guanylyltransferase